MRWLLGGTITAVGAAVLLLSSCSESRNAAAPALFETAFWVWNRTGPLSDPETHDLRERGVTDLLWQLAELALTDGKNDPDQWRVVHRYELPPAPEGLRLTPVVRLSSSVRDPHRWTGAGLAEALAPLLPEGVTHLQLDFDCPTGKLERYAKNLGEFRTALSVPKLSVTALGDWIHAGDLAFTALAGAVDAFYLMLYDTRPDPPIEATGPRPVGLAPSLAEIVPWEKRSPIPVHAGLPNFRRVTLVRDGQWAGHLREWTWNGLAYNDEIQPEDLPRESDALEPGLRIARVTAPTRLARTELRQNDLLVIREPPLDTLHALTRDLRKPGHRPALAGVAFFSLPHEGRANNGWSVSSLLPRTGEEIADAPDLEIRLVSDRPGQLALEVTNEGPRDLPPRPEGYRLSLDAGTPAWRDVFPGDFRLFSPDPGRLLTASKITFQLSHLPAHQSLRSGLLRLAPSVNPAEITFSFDRLKEHPIHFVQVSSKAP